MALDLRQLRDTAPAGRPLRVEEVADQPGVRTSRAAIYAALSAKRLVSREALHAMVKAWAPDGLADLPQWMRRRGECETELAQASDHPPLRIPFGRGLLTRVSEPKSDVIRDEMRRLWSEAGRPPLRELARRTGHMVSYATLSNALGGKHLPSRTTLEAFLVGAGADEETSRTLLSEAANLNNEGGPFEWRDGELIYMDE